MRTEMKKPSYQVRLMHSHDPRCDGLYAVDEYYTSPEIVRVVTSGHRGRIEAEASAAALQGAIERFIQANPEIDRPEGYVPLQLSGPASEVASLFSRVNYLIGLIGWSEEGTFTFPDGDTWYKPGTLA